MADLSPQFPLHFSDLGGYASNTTIHQVVRQNFKNLMLTSPGERIMLPDFGVGVRNYLFEQNLEQTFISIFQRTKNQLKEYMPFVELTDLYPEYEDNSLQISISYTIVPLDYADMITLSL